MSTDLLPQSVRDMIDVVGETAALALVRAFGGRPIKVPFSTDRGIRMYRRLVDIMGSAAAEKFIHHYGGQVFFMPRCLFAMLASRNARIIADYDQGKTVIALAAEHDKTTRQIYQILKSTPVKNAPDVRPSRHHNDDQLALF